MEGIPSLVSSSPLEYFQLNCSAMIPVSEESGLDDFVATLISTHGPRLKGLSINRLPISPKALYDVCAGFVNLEHLFVFLEQMDPVSAYPRIRFVASDSF
jgi:hypothetical protein